MSQCTQYRVVFKRCEMLKHILCLVALAIPLQLTAQERVAKSTGSVAIRFSPPSPWLLGLPGWEVARTEEFESYKLLRTLEIHAFSSTQTWAEVELLAQGEGDPKAGWVYWGASLDDKLNFEIGEGLDEDSTEENESEITERASEENR